MPFAHGQQLLTGAEAGVVACTMAEQTPVEVGSPGNAPGPACTPQPSPTAPFGLITGVPELNAGVAPGLQAAVQHLHIGLAVVVKRPPEPGGVVPLVPDDHPGARPDAKAAGPALEAGCLDQP